MIAQRNRLTASLLALLVGTSGLHAQDLPSLEELLDVQVTSANRKAQPLRETTTAIEVLTAEEIRRIGARNLPELLMHVPGVQVERTGSSHWAVSIRGGNARHSNKLLVLVDGRSVFTPVYSGVAWETQDVLVEDIERIEVIRGPGGTAWGLNAVNGVINVVTKSALSTVGGLATVAAGDRLDYRVALRQGWRLGEDSYLRAYAKSQRIDNFELEDGSSARDDWSATRVGVRADGFLADGLKWTAIAEGASAVTGVTTILPSAQPPFVARQGERQETHTRFALLRLHSDETRDFSWQAQTYVDHTDDRNYAINPVVDTVDLEVQGRWRGSRYDLVAGANLRDLKADFADRDLRFGATDRSEQVRSVFAQGELGLVPEVLQATLGVR